MHVTTPLSSPPRSVTRRAHHYPPATTPATHPDIEPRHIRRPLGLLLGGRHSCGSLLACASLHRHLLVSSGGSRGWSSFAGAGGGRSGSPRGSLGIPLCLVAAKPADVQGNFSSSSRRGPRSLSLLFSPNYFPFLKPLPSQAPQPPPPPTAYLARRSSMSSSGMGLTSGAGVPITWPASTRVWGWYEP